MAVISGVCGGCGSAKLLPNQLVLWFDDDNALARPVGAVCKPCHAAGIRYEQSKGTYVRVI